MIRKILVALFVLTALFSRAQGMNEAGPKMADSFREDGKIYVVISVLGIIFTAIVVFLILIERKLNRLEKEVKGFKN